MRGICFKYRGSMLTPLSKNLWIWIMVWAAQLQVRRIEPHLPQSGSVCLKDEALLDRLGRSDCGKQFGSNSQANVSSSFQTSRRLCLSSCGFSGLECWACHFPDEAEVPRLHMAILTGAHPFIQSSAKLCSWLDRVYPCTISIDYHGASWEASKAVRAL